MKYRKQGEKHLSAEHFYALLLRFYPGVHRREYGPLMLQAFKDYWWETRAVHGRVGITFWLAVIADATKSALREHLWSFQRGRIIQHLWRRPGISFGLLLGMLAMQNIVWTNLLFPKFESEDQPDMIYAMTCFFIFIFLTLVGLLASRRTNRLLSGTWTGAITALVGFGVALFTFFVIDNIWLGIVSQQADKIYGFQHSTFHTMRDYINTKLLSGAVIAPPFIAGIGAMCGTLGAILRKLRAFFH